MKGSIDQIKEALICTSTKGGLKEKRCDKCIYGYKDDFINQRGEAFEDWTCDPDQISKDAAEALDMLQKAVR